MVGDGYMVRNRFIKFLNQLIGSQYLIICKNAYERQQEYYTQKLSEYEQHIASLQIDQAEYQFLRHFAATLIQLEKHLHNSDNADEILQTTFRTACEFYDADWAGFLELDGRRCLVALRLVLCQKQRYDQNLSGGV